MKRIIGYFKSQDGILTLALGVMLGGSAISLLNAFASGAGPATLIAPIVVSVL
jgi:hypothetical protein